VHWRTSSPRRVSSPRRPPPPCPTPRSLEQHDQQFTPKRPAVPRRLSGLDDPRVVLPGKAWITDARRSRVHSSHLRRAVTRLTARLQQGSVWQRLADITPSESDSSRLPAEPSCNCQRSLFRRFDALDKHAESLRPLPSNALNCTRPSPRPLRGGTQHRHDPSGSGSVLLEIGPGREELGLAICRCPVCE